MTDTETEAPVPPDELRPALAAFERGDFVTATAAATPLLTATQTPQVQAAARALLERLAPDPWAQRLTVLTVALLALLVGLYVL